MSLSLSRLGGRCLPFRPGLAVTHLLIGRAPDVRHPPPYGSVLVTVGTAAPAASRACVVNAPRLHSHEAGACSTASPTTPTAGLPVPANPPRVNVRHRRSLPARPGRERLAPRSGQPQPVAGRLRPIDQLPFGSASTAAPPPRNGPRSPASAAPCHRSSTCSTTSVVTDTDERLIPSNAHCRRMLNAPSRSTISRRTVRLSVASRAEKNPAPPSTRRSSRASPGSSSRARSRAMLCPGEDLLQPVDRLALPGAHLIRMDLVLGRNRLHGAVAPQRLERHPLLEVRCVLASPFRGHSSAFRRFWHTPYRGG